MDSSIETSLPGSTLSPKQTLATKPRLAPKPFSLQKNSTIRSIHAPRTVATASKSTSNQPGKAESRANYTLPTTAQTPPQQTTPSDPKPRPVSLPVKDEPKTANGGKESEHREDAPDSNIAPVKPDPAPQTTSVPKVTPPTTAQNLPQQSSAGDSKPIPVSVPIKDEVKPNNESIQIQDTPESSLAQGIIDPAPQTTHVPRVTPPTTAQKPPQQTTTPALKPSPVIEQIKDEQKATNESTHREEDPVSHVAPGNKDQAPQTAPTKEAPKSDVVQRKQKVPAAAMSNSEEKDLKNEAGKTSVIQMPEESGSVSSPTANPEYHWGGTRRRLSTKLTSKFESGGPPLSPQSTVTVSTTPNKDNTNKAMPSALEQSQITPEPSDRERNDGGLMDYSEGGSIKRRISQLFDLSLRPEVVTKKEEPEVVPGSGGVKDRIKNWVMETNSEAPKPQFGSRTRAKSFDSSATPVAEKTPKLADFQLPAAGTQSTQAVAPSSKDSAVKQPTETPLETVKDDAVEKPLESTADVPREHKQDKSVEVEVQLLSPELSADQVATDEGDSGSSESPQSALKRNNTKRRSVRFGIVETDDGGPPLILGSPSDSSSEEEEPSGDKGEENTSVSVPVYRRAAILLNKDSDIKKKEEEQEKQLELEKKLMAEEEEHARHKLEEERRKREEEMEKVNARKREELMHRLEEERERQIKEELEKGRLKEEERKRQMELLQQRQRDEERERIAQKEEQCKKDEEREKERQRKTEVEKSTVEGKLSEWEINLEKPKDKLEKDEDRSRENELELIRQRPKEEGRERARQMEERLRREEMERERLRNEAEERERERRSRFEEEERMRARQRREEEERRVRELEIRMQQDKEEKMETIRQMEKGREEVRKEEERKKQLEKDRMEQLERKMQEELERRLRMEEKAEKEQKLVNQQETAKESNLVSFDDADVPLKSETLLPPLMKTESEMEMIYDDFSVKKPQIEVDFEDFSVKPRRWGSQAKVEAHPVQSWRAEPVDEEVEVDVLVPVDVHPQENKAPEQMAKPDSPEPTPAMASPEEEEIPVEEQLISIDLEEEAEDVERESEDDTKEDDAEEEDAQEAQVNSYCINTDDKDTDALIDIEPDQQNGSCEPTTETDSPKPVPDHVPEVFPLDDTADSHGEPDFASFPESSTPLLDTSAQRSKADLGRRRSRTRPSRSLRLAQTKSQIWRLHDSTDEKAISSKQEDSDPEERQPKLTKVSSPSPTSQRVPTVPGLNPAVLIAQLKRSSVRGGAGKGEVKEEVKQREEKEIQDEEAAPSPSQTSRSPRIATHLAGAALVLPPLSGADGGALSSPAWLKDLKSKKRLSQYDGET